MRTAAAHLLLNGLARQSPSGGATHIPPTTCRTDHGLLALIADPEKLTTAP